MRARTWIVSALLALAPALPAYAHHVERGVVLASAIRIPSLTHGEMRVVARHRSEVLGLANSQMETDETFRRLLNFEAIQFTSCAWGIMPGSISDESSPFNECAHAYLAATWAVLTHMQGMPGDRTTVDALVSKIRSEMQEDKAALVLCSYSEEPFNTAEVIPPHWGQIPFHPPTLLALLGFFATAGGLATFGTVVRRVRAERQGPTLQAW